MNDKIFNLVAKGIMLLIIVIGGILAGIVIKTGNPHQYDDKELYGLGKEVAIKEGKDKSLTQVELDSFIETTGKEIQEERKADQDSNVQTVMKFTIAIIIITLGIVVLAMVFGVALNPKKFIVGIVGIGVLVALVFIVYQTASEELPAKMIERNAQLVQNGNEEVYDAQGMKLAGGAIMSTLILLVLGVVAIVFSSIYKLVK